MGFLHRLTTVTALLKPYEEYLLGGLFLTVSVYAYIEARSWGFAAGTWPRLTAGIVIVLSTLILIQDYLPASIQSLIVDGDTMFSRRQKEAVSEPSAATDTASHTVDEPVSAAVVTAVFTVVYALGGSLIGFLWATPLFIFAFSRWNDTDRSNAVVLAAVGFGIAYGFVAVLGAPIDGGVLTEVFFA